MLSTMAIFALASAQVDAFPNADDRKELAEILRFQRQYGDGVWPGFGGARIPIVFYDDRFEYLIGHPSPPKEWTRIEPRVLAGEDLLRRPAQKVQGFAVKVGEVWCGSFATFDHMSKRLRHSREFHMAATLHEMFHAFQAQSAMERFAKAMEVYKHEKRYPESDIGLIKDWKQEGALLADAVQSRTREEGQSLTLKFLDLRAERRKRAKLDDELIAFETQLEWLEGLGKYAEVKIMELASQDRIVQPLFDLGAASIRREADMFQLRAGLGVAKGDIRYYQSGLAQARLLDRLVPTWKKESLGKVVLEELLKSAL